MIKVQAISNKKFNPNFQSIFKKNNVDKKNTSTTTDNTISYDKSYKTYIASYLYKRNVDEQTEYVKEVASIIKQKAKSNYIKAKEMLNGNFKEHPFEQDKEIEIIQKNENDSIKLRIRDGKTNKTDIYEYDKNGELTRYIQNYKKNPDGYVSETEYIFSNNIVTYAKNVKAKHTANGGNAWIPEKQITIQL